MDRKQYSPEVFQSMLVFQELQSCFLVHVQLSLPIFAFVVSSIVGIFFYLVLAGGSAVKKAR